MKLKRIQESMIMLLGTILFTYTVSVFAGSGSYTSTYRMTGGVFSQLMNPSSTITVAVAPDVGTSGVNMVLFLAQQKWWGWSTSDSLEVSSVYPSSAIFSCSGEYNIWMRNYTGHEWSGAVTFSWR